MNENKPFKPYIPADKVTPEITAVSVITGVILAVVFGAANAYLGLRVGLTVSASIPAAVLSMGIIRVLMRRNSILESNIVQTIGSAGESLAAGAIFTLPALFLWAAEGKGDKPSLLAITVIALCGGILGVLFMVPLRNALIVREHATLPYPEGTACAEVLLAGEEGGAQAASVFSGLGIAAAFKFIVDGVKLAPTEINLTLKNFGAQIGTQIYPALLGATPKKQQIGELIGVVFSSVAIGGVLYLLDKAWGFGTEELAAPQAGLMKMIVEGIMGDQLPWSLIFVGVCLAICLEILRLPVMPIAIGLYLPVQLNACIMVGGLIALAMNSRKKVSEEAKAAQYNDGTLYSAGMIAGEGLVGILLAILAVFNIDPSAAAFLEPIRAFTNNTVGGIVVLAAIVLLLLKFSLWGKNRSRK